MGSNQKEKRARASNIATFALFFRKVRNFAKKGGQKAFIIIPILCENYTINCRKF